MDMNIAKKAFLLAQPLLIAALLSACSKPLAPANSPHPLNPPSHPGLVEIRFSGIGTASLSIKAVRAGGGISAQGLTDTQGGLQLQPVGSGTLVSGSTRYLYATFRVRNADVNGKAYPTPSSDFAFVAVGVPGTGGTIAGTAITRLERFDGSDYGDNPKLRKSIARSILPAHAVTFDGGMIRPIPGAADFQAFSEAEVDPKNFTPPTTLADLGVSTVFPYGYALRCVANCTLGPRTLAPNPAPDQFDGAVTFAVKLPLQANPKDNPYAFSLMVETLGGMPSRVTLSPEEGNDLGGALGRVRALGAQSLFAIGSGTRTVSAAQYNTLLSGAFFPVLGFSGVENLRTADPDPGYTPSDPAEFGQTAYLLPNPQTVPTFSLPPLTEIASVGSNGQQGPQDSFAPAISDDGRYVAFIGVGLDGAASGSTFQVFLRDRFTQQTRLVSASNAGVPASFGAAIGTAISANGRYVAFVSGSSNLVAGDTNGFADVFLRDTMLGTTERVNLNGSAQSAGDDLTLLGSLPVQYRPALSADGRYVAFVSRASDLVSGDTNGKFDVFLRDRLSGTTSRISVASDGTEGDGDSTSPAISADGRYLAFYSGATNFGGGVGGVFVRDTVAGTTTRVSFKADGSPDKPAGYDGLAISGDGRYVAYTTSSAAIPEDTDGKPDVYVRDLVASKTIRASVANDGSAPLGNVTGSWYPSISRDGRRVAFSSDATNLVPGDTNDKTDVFVRDLVAGTTELESRSSSGVIGNDRSSHIGVGNAFYPVISGNGRYVALSSKATNLLDGTPDTNNSLNDVFVRTSGIALP